MKTAQTTTGISRTTALKQDSRPADTTNDDRDNQDTDPINGVSYGYTERSNASRRNAARARARARSRRIR